LAIVMILHIQEIRFAPQRSRVEQSGGKGTGFDVIAYTDQIRAA
jgi:hypothetical protein